MSEPILAYQGELGTVMLIFFFVGTFFFFKKIYPERVGAIKLSIGN